MKRAVHVYRVMGLCLIVALLAVILSLPARPIPVSAQGPEATATAAPAPDSLLSPELALEWAQRVAEDSSRAVESANTILSLIESFGVLLGALIAVVGILGTLLGIRTVTDLNRTRERFNEEITAASKRLLDFQQQFDSNMIILREQGDRAIQALTLLQLGKQQMDARNLDAALNTLRQAHAYDPSNRAINYFMGELYIQLERLDEGIEYLIAAGAESSLEDGDFPAAKAAYAYALRRKGDRAADPDERRKLYYKSEGLFRDALERNPKLLDMDGESHYGALGGLYQRQGRIQEAIECYERAMQATRSTSSYPYNNLGILYTQLGQFDKARPYFEQAVRTADQNLDDKPHDFWARFDMVTAQIMLNNPTAVHKHLPLALQTAPSVDRLETFLGGLQRLQKSASSELLSRVIEIVQHDIERRKTEAAKAETRPGEMIRH